MKIALGADHAGFELKEKIKKYLQEKRITVDDRGTHSTDSVDYPDYALRVGEEVAAGEAGFGILVGGSGIGMSSGANKGHGGRAADVTSQIEGRVSRWADEANVLALG